MMKLTAILTLSLMGLSSAGDMQKQYYDNGKLKSQVVIENGMLNGKYNSFYKNGNKKAEGTIINNQRTGTWSVWDSTGQIRMTRKYENPYKFETLLAKNRKDNNVNIEPGRQLSYTLAKNTNGYFEYPQLTEKDLGASNRYWRTIEANTTNNILFKNNLLLELVLKNLRNPKTSKDYSPTSDFEKMMPVNYAEVLIMENKKNITSYRIKEDWIFNKSVQVGETRIIGLCPLATDKTTGKETELFWIYFPSMRSLLASEKISLKDAPDIKTIDDLFFYRYFNSSVYKKGYEESKINFSANYENEIETLDLEHDVWINLTEK